MGHSDRVTRYAIKTAKAMGLSEESQETVNYAGLLHDLGKIGIADSILLKPSGLSDEEWEEIKKHPTKSEGIARFISFLKSTLPIIRHHHERFDGKGYPEGLSGENIPIGARIIAVCDTFDAITSKRPYRDKKSDEEALKIIKESAGTQLDPKIVLTFLKVIEDDKT